MNELFRAIRRILESLEDQINGDIQPSYPIKTELLVDLLHAFEECGEEL